METGTVSLKKRLTEGHYSPKMVALGNAIDFSAKEVSVTPERAESILHFIARFEGTVGNFKDLQRLAGKLNNASVGVWGGYARPLC